MLNIRNTRSQIARENVFMIGDIGKEIPSGYITYFFDYFQIMVQ